MTRDDNVLALKIVLINTMHRYFKLSWDGLSAMMTEYNILPFIDVSYEQFCSMGVDGVLQEIENFVKEQGGNIE